MGKLLDTVRLLRLGFSPISRFRASWLLMSAALFAGLGGGVCALAANSDEQFLAAEEAFRIRDTKALEYYVPALKDHFLADYPEYWLLQLTLKDADAAPVIDFLQRHPDGPLAERLRINWLRLLGQNEEWDAFSAQFPQLRQEDTELTCYELRRRVAHGDTQALKQAHPLWFVGRSQPESCEPLFAQLLGDNLLSSEDVWARIRLASLANNAGVLTAANSYLPTDEAIDTKAFGQVRHAPTVYLAKKSLPLQTRAAREIAIFSVLQIARKDHRQAAVLWSAMSNRFPQTDQGEVWGQIAFQAAWAQDPAALMWFKKAGDAPLNDMQLGWQVRAALRAKNWPDVLSAIDRMSETEQQFATWRYWKARALKQQGKSNEARDLFLPLSQELSFYGQLASEEIGTVLSNPKETWKPSVDDLKNIEQSSGVK
ncbi:MAG: transglycosylase, partial [Pseudomonadota bacterium]|nr:transglycosylase [Pseudomonadota bacterium]